MPTLRVALGLLVLAALLAACKPAPSTDDAVGYPWTLPAGFPLPAVPDDNAMSASKALLGRYLFYDTRLSVNSTYACGSCHQQEHAFAGTSVHAFGCTGQEHRRNAMSLTNVAYNAAFTWASQDLRTLEQQVLVPMFGDVPVELGLADQDRVVVARLAADGRYPGMFTAAFPGDPSPITMAHVEQAITSFERTLISSNSLYDQSLATPPTATLSASAQNGRALFFGERLECYHCHGGFNFSDATTHAGQPFDELTFHNTGLYNIGGTGAYPADDQGLIESTMNPSDMGKYRAPTLRNIALTAPYFHDGSAATLDDVIAHYAAGGRTIATGPNAGDGSLNPFKDGLIRGFTLTDQEHADVLAFLQSLTDPSFVTDPRFSNPFVQRAGTADLLDCPNDMPATCPSAVPSYAGQIQAIVQTRCVNCHTPGGPGTTWPLVTWDQIHALQTPMLGRIAQCDMPPTESQTLTLAEHTALITWLACGAPNN